MPLASDAKKIHGDVRAFFKGREKSTNKAYFPIKASDVQPTLPKPAASEEGADLRDKKQSMLSQKHATRNRNVMLNHDALVTLQGYDRAPTTRGQLVALQEIDGPRVGNCYEMASMAAWNVSTFYQEYHAAMCGINDPGDHAFCIVWEDGSTMPAWQCVPDFRKETRELWAIDPWANVCCLLRDYELEFVKKMTQWASQGKRIWQQSKKQNRKGWHIPNGTLYLTGFKTGPVRYTAVERPPPTSSSPMPALLCDQFMTDHPLYFDLFHDENLFPLATALDAKPQRQEPAFMTEALTGSRIAGLPNLPDLAWGQQQIVQTGPAFKKRKQF